MKHLYDAIIPVLIQLQASLIAIGQYRCEMFVLNIELIFLLVCFTWYAHKILLHKEDMFTFNNKTHAILTIINCTW